MSDDTRDEVECGFQENPPQCNVLVCTPTLELGVNIGDLEAVTMGRVPTQPSLWLSGRFRPLIFRRTPLSLLPLPLIRKGRE